MNTIKLNEIREISDEIISGQVTNESIDKIKIYYSCPSQICLIVNSLILSSRDEINEYHRYLQVNKCLEKLANIDEVAGCVLLSHFLCLVMAKSGFHDIHDSILFWLNNTKDESILIQLNYLESLFSHSGDIKSASYISSLINELY